MAYSSAMFFTGYVRVLKNLEFYSGIFQDCQKVLNKDHRFWTVLEICLTQLKRYEVYGRL